MRVIILVRLSRITARSLGRTHPHAYWGTPVRLRLWRVRFLNDAGLQSGQPQAHAHRGTPVRLRLCRMRIRRSAIIHPRRTQTHTHWGATLYL